MENINPQADPQPDDAITLAFSNSRSFSSIPYFMRDPYINLNDVGISLYDFMNGGQNPNQIFHFEQSKHFDFDTEKDNFASVCEQIKIFPGYKFNFDVIRHDNRAYGHGATKQVYHKLLNDIVSQHGTIMIKTHPYFMDINTDHDFWKTD